MMSSARATGCKICHDALISSCGGSYQSGATMFLPLPAIDLFEVQCCRNVHSCAGDLEAFLLLSDVLDGTFGHS